MNLQDLKIYFFNASALSISMTNIDVVLKLLLLVVTIGYTMHKWYIMNENRKKWQTRSIIQRGGVLP